MAFSDQKSSSANTSSVDYNWTFDDDDFSDDENTHNTSHVDHWNSLDEYLGDIDGTYALPINEATINHTIEYTMDMLSRARNSRMSSDDKAIVLEQYSKLCNFLEEELRLMVGSIQPAIALEKN
jgi:hypothetical protein